MTPSRRVIMIVVMGGVTACSTDISFNIGQNPFARQNELVTPICSVGDTVCENVITAGDETMRPHYRGGAGEAIAGAVALSTFDTATAGEIAAAKVDDGAAERALGTTVASLGDVSKPGFWLDTPLVTKVAQGRVVGVENGISVNVELRPKEGAETTGSQISLAALRALGISLTALPKLTVYGP